MIHLCIYQIIICLSGWRLRFLTSFQAEALSDSPGAINKQKWTSSGFITVIYAVVNSFSQKNKLESTGDGSPGGNAAQSDTGPCRRFQQNTAQ